MAALQSGGNISRRDPCKKCGLPVFLAERLNVDNHLYHRTCFRCARCSHQLSLANYYETEDCEYCCETCPDEEDTSNKHDDLPDYQQNVLTQSLSDEEKEQGLNKDISLYSDNLPVQSKIYTYEKFTNARSNFVGSQLNINAMETNEDDIDVDPPDLPTTKPPDKNLTDIEVSVKLFNMPTPNVDHSDNIELANSLDKVSSGLGSSEDVSIKISENVEDFQIEKNLQDSNELYVENVINHDSGTSLSAVELSNKEQEDKRNSVRDDFKDIVNINSTNSFKYNSDSINQPLATDITTLEALDRTNNTEFVTKDEESNTVTDKNEPISLAAASNISLVKLRKQQFEVDNDENIPVVVTAMNSELIKKYVPLNDDYLYVDKQPSSDVNNTVISVRSQKSNSEEQLDNSNNIPLTIEHEGIKSDINEILVDKNEIIVKEKLETKVDDYPEELNPFEDDDDLFENETATTSLNTTVNIKDSTNPFGSDDDDHNDDDNVNMPSYSNSPFKKLLQPPKDSLNPFLSEDEENSSEETSTSNKPVPKPRSIHLDHKKTPEPTPRSQKLGLNTSSGFHGSSTSLESVKSGKSTVCSPYGTYRKKKPAPLPPTSKDVFGNVADNASTKDKPPQITAPTVKIRKNRPAPAPPTAPSPNKLQTTNRSESPSTLVQRVINAQIDHTNIEQSSPTKSTSSELEKEKNSKDEKNRNRQSMTLVSTHTNSVSSESEVSLNLSPPNKSTFGKWKRKKGPAPPRPVPQRRQINVLPADELRRQLDVIEIQQLGLEKQGVKLEQLIRDKSEIPGINEDSSLTQEVEDLVLQLFELVNEKNELFRKQAELMYLRRQQRLEEEHADLEYQIRCLMERPESNKTDYDKTREEELINRLIEVVETRNEIIECLEMDRIREAEEDESISTHLNLYAAKRDEDLLSITSSSQESTKLSKKEKKKQKKIKKTKGVTIDADKDVDETEFIQKEKKKKKWLFHV